MSMLKPIQLNIAKQKRSKRSIKTKIRILSTLIIPNLCFITDNYSQTLVLPTLNISSTHAAKKSTDNTGTNVTFSQKNIQEQGASSVIGFLKQQSLVQIKTSSGQQDQTAIAIHGFGDNAHSNSLLHVDGLPFSSFTNIGPNLNTIMIQNINTINLIPGSYGSLYGSQAVGGAVNLTTHIPGKRELYTGLSLGNRDQSQTNFFYSERYPSDLGVSLGGAFANISHDQDKTQKNYNINAKVDYISDNDSASLNWLSYRNYIENQDALTWGSNTPVAPIMPNSTTQGHVLYATNQLMINPAWQWNSQAMLLYNKITGMFRGTAPTETNQSSLLLQNNISYLNFFSTGIDLQKNSAHTLSNNIQNAQANDKVADIYSRAKLPIINKLDLILGARYANQWMNANTTVENSSTHNHFFANEQGLVWQQTSELEFYLRRDTNYRFVNGKDRLWAPTTTEINPVQMQTGISYETGLKWHHGAHKFELGLYRLDLNNELTYDPNAGPFGSISNLPPTRRIGLDLYNQLPINDRLTLNTQASLVRARFSSGNYSGKQIPAVSPVSTSLGLTYQWPKNWSFNIIENHYSSFYAVNDLANQAPKMAGYFTTDINFRKTWHKLAMNLSIKNLLNKHYTRYALYSPTIPGISPASLTYYPADGITALFTMEYNWV
ncbi:TonB-dependent receptor [Piscirickettsia salmonis]|uniref:TonB-dependent receptor n=2 Tax=Piscirickettsia salmonis TaxID=1238 RepID=UPI001E37EE74|nr:TonB-dependent receptor [Piscirickettsia salmonis]